MKASFRITLSVSTGTLVGASSRAAATTSMARKLVLERIEAIEAAPTCRAKSGQQQIDLDLLRKTARRTWFYNPALKQNLCVKPAQLGAFGVCFPSLSRDILLKAGAVSGVRLAL